MGKLKIKLTKKMQNLYYRDEEESSVWKWVLWVEETAEVRRVGGLCRRRNDSRVVWSEERERNSVLEREK